MVLRCVARVTQQRKCFLGILAVCCLCVIIYITIFHTTFLYQSTSPSVRLMARTSEREDAAEQDWNSEKKNIFRELTVTEIGIENTDSSDGGGDGGGVTPRTLLGVKLPPDLSFIAKEIVQDVKPSVQRKMIVMLNRPSWMFPSDPNYQTIFNTCPYTCTMTDDRRHLPHADAVWVDIGRLNAPNPPPNRPPSQMWVAFNIESPVHFLGNHNSASWKSVFNWTFSYRTDADIFRPYGQFVLRDPPPGKNYTQIILNKTKPIAWFVSNCHAGSRRAEYVKELSKYIDVDIYGSCGPLKCPGLLEEKCLALLNTTYFFYLAFENSYCQDYMTEKLFKTYWNLNVIPIVRGALNSSKYLPPDTYLDTADFPSPRSLAQYLHTVMKDVQTYSNMLWTKDHFYTPYSSWVRPNLMALCQLCRKLQISPPASKVYPDIMEWSKKCWSSPDV